MFQVLNTDPSLIAELLPNMWQEVYNSNRDKVALPSAAEVKQFFRLLSKRRDSSCRYCFFIDGLDEYSGNYLDATSFVKTLSDSPNIKLVVSSRPISVCVDAFHTRPKLQLQDLTSEDIKIYVHDVLGTHSYMGELLDIDPSETTKMLEDIVSKASGVFLWVVLACRSVLTGFAAFDKVLDLRDRVDQLPLEL